MSGESFQVTLECVAEDALVKDDPVEMLLVRDD